MCLLSWFMVVLVVTLLGLFVLNFVLLKGKNIFLFCMGYFSILFLSIPIVRSPRLIASLDG